MQVEVSLPHLFRVVHSAEIQAFLNRLAKDRGARYWRILPRQSLLDVGPLTEIAATETVTYVELKATFGRHPAYGDKVVIEPADGSRAAVDDWCKRNRRRRAPDFRWNPFPDAPGVQKQGIETAGV
jgi:hypothetical protein